MRWDYVRPEKLISARIDPGQKVPLDINWLNNGRRVEPNQRAAAAWTAGYYFWAQQALALLGL